MNAERALERLNKELEKRVKSTEEGLGRTQAQLRALAASLFQSQEDERRRVARELHDDIAQQLAVLEISLQQLQDDKTSSLEEIRRRIGELQAKTARLGEDIRSISHRLHPSVIDDLGLPAALRSLVDEFGEREEMPASLFLDKVPETIPRDVAAVLYRITQEALRNVAKHAGETHVKVSLEGSNNGLLLQVADLGEGFDPATAGRGLGLVSMAERVRLVNGSFDVKSALGKGTVVTVQVPLPA